MKAIKSLWKIGIALATTGLILASVSFFNKEKSSRYNPRENQESQDINGAMAWYKMMRSDIRTGEMNFDLIAQVSEQIRKNDAAKRNAPSMRYSFVGPSNEGGRTRAILVDKDNSERVFAGGVSGGLFISDNGGNNWTTDWDFSESLLISSICQTTNGDIYLGTGCSHENGNFGGGTGAPGVGVYKSSDKGETWTLLASTEDWDIVNHLEAHPTLPNVVFAATGSGLRVSQDGGATWTNPIYVDQACTIPRSGECQHVQFNSDGSRVFVGMNGTMFQSNNPLASCTYEVFGAPFPSSSERIMIATTPADDDIVYAGCINPANNALWDIYQSKDGGNTWASMDPNVPRSSPNYDHFGESRGSGQGWFDFSFAASPVNPNILFVGGVQMWRYDGNWTLAANSGGSGRFSMHVDHHTIAYDPNNPNIVYFGHDGGISKSLDGGYTFFDMDNGYQTTQFYGIATSKNGVVMGGTQDNGNLVVDPSVFGTPDYAFSVFNQGVTNGDGFDCEISNIVDVKFTTAQNSSIGRSRILDESGAGIVDTINGTGLFNTVVRLWESDNDFYSKDSIEFVVDTSDQVIAVANGSQKQFTGTIEPEQASANVIYNSVFASAGIARAHDFDGDGILEGDGTGTVNAETGVVSVTWNVTPQTNTQIKLHYTANYKAGSVLNLQSKTENLPVRHVLKFDIGPNDRLLVQDPIQSVLAMNSGWNPNSQANGNGIVLTRNGLRFNEEIKWTFLPVGQSTCMEFSPDGRHLYVGSGSGIRRISGIEKIYYPMNDAQVAATITNTPIYTGNNVAGMAINPSNPNQMIVTLGNYGRSTNVVELNNIETRTSADPGRSVQGNLPGMPVFDAEYNINNPKQVVLGTDFGVYVTDDITAVPTEWSHEVVGFSHAPVYDVRQQQYPGAMNEGVFYFGTHGRGIWKSETLVGTVEHYAFASEKGLGDLTIFPNPVVNNATIALSSDSNKEVELKIYNIKGDLVRYVQDLPVQEGRNEIPLNVSNLKPGAYILSMENASTKKVSKFLISR